MPELLCPKKSHGSHLHFELKRPSFTFSGEDTLPPALSPLGHRSPSQTHLVLTEAAGKREGCRLHRTDGRRRVPGCGQLIPQASVPCVQSNMVALPSTPGDPGIHERGVGHPLEVHRHAPDASGVLAAPAPPMGGKPGSSPHCRKASPHLVMTALPTA